MANVLLPMKLTYESCSFFEVVEMISQKKEERNPISDSLLANI